MFLLYESLCGMLFETEQDEGLEKLEETVVSTKHIALAVNEELDLHTRLIVCVFSYPFHSFSYLPFLFKCSTPI
jgi:hypothetical protein